MSIDSFRKMGGVLVALATIFACLFAMYVFFIERRDREEDELIDATVIAIQETQKALLEEALGAGPSQQAELNGTIESLDATITSLHPVNANQSTPFSETFEDPNSPASTFAIATDPPTQSPTEIPAPSPLPSSVIPPSIIDNFDNGASPYWNILTGSWLMVNGKYTITDINDWTTGIALIGDKAWTNYDITVDVNLNDTSQQNNAYLMVRVQDLDNFLILQIGDHGRCCWATQAYSKWFIVNSSEWKEVSNTTFSDYPIDGFTLKVQVQGDIIRTYINGQQINVWSNAPYLFGNVGLRIDSNSASDPATFDNFSLMPLGS